MSAFIQFLILPLLFSANQGTEFKIDPTNTKIEFSAKHFGVINVRGHFSQFNGSLSYDGKTIKNINVKINVNSIDTGNNGRDKSLKNDTFLDAENYPHITFKSIEENPINSMKGVLTIKGSSRPAAISYTLERKDKGGEVLKGEYLFKRTDFNLVFGSMNDLVSNEIRVFLELSLPDQNNP